MKSACNMNATSAVDLTKIKPYGDTMNDGMMQLSFTLPVPYGEESSEAAKILAKKMGLDEPAVVFSKTLESGIPILWYMGNALTRLIIPPSR